MTTPTVVPSGYQGDFTDYLNAPGSRKGDIRQISGTVTVPNATAAGVFVGLFPVQKGARFSVHDKSFHVSDIDSGTDSLVNFGIVYDDNTTFTNDVDLFVTQDDAGQTGTFAVINNTAWMTYEALADGWVVMENDVNATEAEGTVTFNVGVQYG